MSMDDLKALAVRTPCGYCGADPGEWCRTRPGNHRASYLHAARIDPVYAIWREAYQEGRKDGRWFQAKAIANDLQAARYPELAKWANQIGANVAARESADA